MKHKRLTLMLSAALAASASSSAYAVTPVYDMAVHSSTTATAIAAALIYDEMLYTRKNTGTMLDNDNIYYNDMREQWDVQQTHNENNTDYNNETIVYHRENNYYCNAGEGEASSLATGGDYFCGDDAPGDGDIPIPGAYGAGKFGDHDTSVAYMDSSRRILDEVGAHDAGRMRTVMEGNAVQAKAVDMQVADFDAQRERLQTLGSLSTKNMGARMQAAYSNQIAAVQTGEMMQMRALMLADQNAQLLREQEASALDAKQSVAESGLRAQPNLGAASVSAW